MTKLNDNHGVWAAIVIFNENIEVLAKPQLTNEFFAVASINLPGHSPIDIISGYFQFRKDTRIFTQYLTDMRDKLSDRALLGLDVNAFKCGTAV